MIGNFASLEPLPPKTKHAAPPLNAKKEYIASLRPKPCAAFSKNLACWSGYLAVDSTPYTSQEPVVDSTSPRSKYTDSSPYFAEIFLVEAFDLLVLNRNERCVLMVRHRHQNGRKEMGERIFANDDDTERQLLFPLSDNKDDERATRRLASISPFPTKRRVFKWSPKEEKKGGKKKWIHICARANNVFRARENETHRRVAFFAETTLAPVKVELCNANIISQISVFMTFSSPFFC